MALYIGDWNYILYKWSCNPTLGDKSPKFLLKNVPCQKTKNKIDTQKLFDWTKKTTNVCEREFTDTP